MEFMDEQSRFENGMLGHDFLMPLLGELAILPLLEKDE